MKRYILISFLIVLISLAPACSTHDDTTCIQLIDQSHIMITADMNEYSYSEVLAFLANYPSIYEINKKFDVPYYKYFHNFGYYSIIKTDECYILLIFDSELILSYCKKIFINNNDTSIQKIKGLYAGQHLSDVTGIDPYGDYEFQYKNLTGYPKISYHFIYDGNCFAITYNEDYYITSIEHFTI